MAELGMLMRPQGLRSETIVPTCSHSCYTTESVRLKHGLLEVYG